MSTVGTNATVRFDKVLQFKPDRTKLVLIKINEANDLNWLILCRLSLLPEPRN